MNGEDRDKIIKLEVKMDQTDKTVGEVREDVKEILTNHLPHISNQLTSLTVKVTLGATVASMVASAIVAWFFR